MQSRNLYATLISPLSNTSFNLTGYGFVDDTELLATPQKNNSLIHTFQSAIDGWAGILGATGGALEPEKSFDMIVEWTNKHGKWTMNPTKTRRTTMTNQYGNSITLDRVPTNVGKRALGVRLAADGNNTAESEYLQTKAKHWAHRLLTSKSNRSITWAAFNTTIIPSLSYPLGATTFTRDQADSILRPLLSSVLATGGIARSFPRSVVHGPLALQGLQLPHLYVEQGVKHIGTILQHSGKKTLTGKLIQQSMEALQWEIGLPQPILNRPFQPFLKCHVATWLTCLWEFLDTNNCSIHDTGINHFPLQRENDAYIMEALQFKHTPTDLADINTCRRWLNITRLSEVISLTGHRLSLPQLKGAKHRVDTPTSNQWSAWEEAIFLLLPTVTPLGNWYDNMGTGWWILGNSNLYHQDTGNQYLKLSGGRTRLQRFATRPLLPATELPDRGQRVRVKVVRGQHQVTETSQQVSDIHSTIYGPKNWYQQGDRQLEWIYKHTQQPLSFQPILEAIQTFSARAVCDGSTKDGVGTAATIITDTHSRAELTSQVNVPTVTGTCSSYRAELYGIYVVMHSIYMLETAFHVTTGSITIKCDNKPAVYQSDWDGPVAYSMPEYDLISAIQHIKSISNIKFHIQHVQGHQDRHPSTVLDDWARLNIRMDTNAKEQWGQHINDGTKLLGEPWQLFYNLHQIAKDMKEQIRFAGTIKQIKAYWAKRNPKQFDHVNTQTVSQTMKELPTQRQRWLTKHVTGICGVKQKLYKWKMANSPNCPRCGIEETSQHVWECRGMDADVQWAKSLTELSTFMTDIQTCPETQQSIINGLNRWRNKEPGPNHENHIIQIAIQQQFELGWYSLIEGRMANAWSDAQASYLTTIASRRSSRRWTIEIAKKLIGIAWDLWTHRNGIEHQVFKGEQRQKIYTKTTEILVTNGPYTKEKMDLWRRVASLSAEERQQLPLDYLIRWCKRMA
jgi:hypothetical protein